MQVGTFWTILLIVHGLLAVALLGAISHQAASVLAGFRMQHRTTEHAGDNFIERFSRVRGQGYASAVCVLWMATFLLGGWIYTKYRIAIRIPMEQEGFWKTQGAFELKEHLATIGLLLLPYYWSLWKGAPSQDGEKARRWITLILASIVWYLFLVGHIVNNVRGFGS